MILVALAAGACARPGYMYDTGSFVPHPTPGYCQSLGQMYDVAAQQCTPLAPPPAVAQMPPPAYPPAPAYGPPPPPAYRPAYAPPPIAQAQPPAYTPPPAPSAPAMAQSDTGGFTAMLGETGCDSKYSDEKKADIFEAKYKGKQMTVSGTISKVSGGEVLIRVLPSTLSYDVGVTLSDPKSAYDLQIDRRVTVRFIVRRAGGCVLPYSGDQGVLVP